MVGGGLKNANVNYSRSLAVLRGGLFKLHNLVHSRAGLTLLVHLLGVMVDRSDRYCLLLDELYRAAGAWLEAR